MTDISIRQRRGRSQQEGQKFATAPLFCHKEEEKMFVGGAAYSRDKWLPCRGEERRGEVVHAKKRKKKRREEEDGGRREGKGSRMEER